MKRRPTRWLAAVAIIGIAITALRFARRPTADTEQPALIPPSEDTHPLGPAAELSLDLTAPLFEAAREMRTPTAVVGVPDAVEPPPAKLPSPFKVAGRVVDDIGRAAPSFAIIAEPAATAGRAHTVQVYERFEGTDGSFVVGIPSTGEWQVFAVDANWDGQRGAPVLVDVARETGDIVLVLPRLGGISGSVVNTHGSALSGAKVYLSYLGGRDFVFRGERELEPEVETDAFGAFQIEGVVPGVVKLMARHVDYCDGTQQELLVVPAGLHTGVQLELSQGGRIEGFADPSLGSVGDRRVDLYSFRGASGWRDTRTDPAGRFVIERVVPQDYVIDLRPKGYGKAGASDEPSIRKNISVTEGNTTHVTFAAAQREIRVHGTLTRSGAPAAGLNIRAFSRTNDDRGTEAESGADGRYELVVDGPGAYRFTVSSGFGSDVHLERAVPDEDDVELDLEIPGGVLAGRVLAADGRPLSHVWVSAVRSGWSDATRFHRDHYRKTFTNLEGEFAIRLLPPGDYTLRAPDGAPQRAPDRRFRHGRVVLTDVMLGDSPMTDIELRLPAECRIAGVVVDAHGHPVADASVRALDERGISISGDWEARTDATGHFQIGSVAPGRYQVRVLWRDRDVVGASFTVEAGKTASCRVEIR